MTQFFEAYANNPLNETIKSFREEKDFAPSVNSSLKNTKITSWNERGKFMSTFSNRKGSRGLEKGVGKREKVEAKSRAYTLNILPFKTSIAGKMGSGRAKVDRTRGNVVEIEGGRFKGSKSGGGFGGRLGCEDNLDGLCDNNGSKDEGVEFRRFGNVHGELTRKKLGDFGRFEKVSNQILMILLKEEVNKVKATQTKKDIKIKKEVKNLKKTVKPNKNIENVKEKNTVSKIKPITKKTEQKVESNHHVSKEYTKFWKSVETFSQKVSKKMETTSMQLVNFCGSIFKHIETPQFIHSINQSKSQYSLE